MHPLTTIDAVRIIPIIATFPTPVLPPLQMCGSGNSCVMDFTFRIAHVHGFPIYTLVSVKLIIVYFITSLPDYPPPKLGSITALITTRWRRESAVAFEVLLYIVRNVNLISS